MIENLIRQFKSEYCVRSEGYVFRCEDVLAEIAALQDPCCIEPLIELFDDDAECDELMFSILHTIEMFDDPIYTIHIINAVVEFAERSPRWAAIVHIRILNSPSTREAYAMNLAHISSNQRCAIQSVLEDVCSEDEEFRAPSSTILQNL